MAANSVFNFLCFLLLLLLPCQAEGNNLRTVSAILSEKGYHAMSLTFDDMLLDSLQIDVTGNSTLTLLCPPDHAFLSSKLYPQPPLTLLQYHLVPSKLSRDELVSLPPGSKVETLLLGHPLVVTTLPGSDYVTLNEVRITEWNVYNDGGLIIHGVEDFFDPGFQTLRYPWYDAKEIHAKVADGFSWIMGKVTQNWILSLLMIAILVLIVVLLSFCVEQCRHQDYHLFESLMETKSKNLIVHGIDGFFNPAFQTLKYPRFDDDHDVKKETKVDMFSWVIKGLKDYNWAF